MIQVKYSLLWKDIYRFQQNALSRKAMNFIQ